MKENQNYTQRFLGCFVSFVCILLAIWAVAISTRYMYPENPDCGNMLGAGFPVMFICDNWGGGSPTSSWGKIDFVDVLNGGIIPTGFLVDFLFYFILIGIIWFIVSRIIHRSSNQSYLSWTMFISIGFIAGFLCAFLVFQPGYFEYVRHISLPLLRTPTPTISFQTPIGTLPIRSISPAVTPIATLIP